MDVNEEDFVAAYLLQVLIYESNLHLNICLGILLRV